MTTKRLFPEPQNERSLLAHYHKHLIGFPPAPAQAIDFPLIHDDVVTTLLNQGWHFTPYENEKTTRNMNYWINRYADARNKRLGWTAVEVKQS